RTESACSMRRNDHPSRPSARICCCVVWSKTLLIPSTEPEFRGGVNVSTAIANGRFQLSINGRFWMSTEDQWEPLWDDVVRVAERVLSRPTDKHHPHFLGAVVLQQVQKQTGQMQERTIIDGQQRLTTLQLLMDALHAELQAVNAQQAAMRIEPLVVN